MPIKNYIATVPANCSISQIQYTIVIQDSSCFLCKYEQGKGRIEALRASDGARIKTLSFLFLYIGVGITGF
jgi:hypothetical protein